ncbi:hypothetical protein HRUBRA_02213 [Pseudohaliea rubra DSM 19751]|uniref:NAD-specific glutamate dehydrogenase n=1 Tax=Pseudohaliea rubra DSM 19751 TaxID=1265313 RepID=A0A095VPF9_9GAMM|nr:hypothetical protein HRUBRA_02213 [Pseudohaliea rubra DSM 19751]
MLEGELLALCRLPAPLLDKLRLVLTAHAHVGQELHHLVLEAGEQRLEQRKGLALVLLLRVLLRIGAQVDALAQVVHGRQVFLPQRVEHLQHDLLLDLAHVRAHLLALGVVGGLDGLHNALAQALLFELIVLVEPLLHRQLDGELGLQLALEAGDVPLLLNAHGRHVAVDGLVDHILADRRDRVVDVGLIQQLVALLVDDLALVVGDIVVLEKLLANVEVAALNLALRLLDGVGDHAVLDGLALLHAQCLHKALDPVRGEDAHEVVFKGQVEARDPRIALAAGPAPELVVDAPGLVALGAEDMQTAGFQNPRLPRLPGRAQFLLLRLVDVAGSGELRIEVATKDNIGAAARHVGGDGDHPGAAGLGDNLRLLLVVLGVEHLVLDLRLAEALRQLLGVLDRRGTDEDRRVLGDAGLHVVDDGVELLLAGEVHQVVEVLAYHRLVGGDHQHLEAVDLAELEGFRVRRAGHAGQLLVEAEVVLEGGGRERLALGLDRHALFRLDGLVQALGQAPAGHGAPGVLVDEHHLAALHDVLHVAVVEHVGAQARVDVVQELQVGCGVETVALLEEPGLGEQPLDKLVALFRELDLARLLVDVVVAGVFLRGRAQPRHQGVDALVQLRAVFRGAGDDQRRARLVDKDRVHFVDDGKGQLTLELVVQGEGHVVAEIIEAELVVGAVDHVAAVGGALLLRQLAGADHAHLQTEELVERPHPAGVPAGEIVVHGDQVHRLAGERVEVGRQCGHEGLALTGAHLGDLALVKSHATDELHIEVTHAEHPAARLPTDRKGVREHSVEALAGAEALAELVTFGRQRVVVEGLQGLLEGIDLAHDLAQAFQLPFIAGAEDFFQGLVNHRLCWFRSVGSALRLRLVHRAAGRRDEVIGMRGCSLAGGTGPGRARL